MNVLYMRILFTLISITLGSLSAVAQIVSASTTTIVTNDTLFCTDRPITYSASASADGWSFLWSVVPSKGLSSYTDLNSPSVTLTFSTASTHTVYLNIKDASGATNTVQTKVTPGRSAKAAFNASLNSAGYPVQLTLTNYSSNSVRNLWTFSDNTQDSSFNVVKGYNASGNYKVSLFVEGLKGCNDMSSYDFVIDASSSITLPNVFTPNNDDVNDVYTPITKGISSLNAWIFNRDGVVVANWDKPKEGWDGHSTSGEECDAGVYFIVVNASGFDGQTYKLKGNITLLR